MSKEPDECFKWIGHAIDHFSKYHILFPLLSKEGAEVAMNLIKYVFSYFGLPYLLHCDNGREFVNEVVEKWPGECQIIHGKPRSPWVQGLVERTNACVESMIAAKRHETKTNHWSMWLSDIQCMVFPVLSLFEFCFLAIMANI